MAPPVRDTTDGFINVLKYAIMQIPSILGVLARHLQKYSFFFFDFSSVTVIKYWNIF